MVIGNILVPVRGLRNPVGVVNGPYPLRIHHPFSGAGDGLRGSGDWGKVVWSIADLCLVLPVGQLSSPNTPPTLLMAQVAAKYAEITAVFRGIGEDGNPIIKGRLRGVRITPSVYEWPVLSTNMYYGVELVIDAEEFLI